MFDPNDLCSYLKEIEKDPKAIAPRVTIRQFQEIQEHVQTCIECRDRAERITAAHPDERNPYEGNASYLN